MSMEDYEDDSLALDDDCVGTGGVLASGEGSGLMLARRYDVSITYGEFSRVKSKPVKYCHKDTFAL